MRWIVVVAVIALNLIAIESATAHYSSAYPERHFGRHIALQVWKENPTCGTPRILMRNFPKPYVGSASSHYCEIWVDRFRSKAYTCMIILHEWGHLMGRDHSFGAFEIMNPIIIYVDKRCKQ